MELSLNPKVINKYLIPFFFEKKYLIGLDIKCIYLYIYILLYECDMICNHGAHFMIMEKLFTLIRWIIPSLTIVMGSDVGPIPHVRERKTPSIQINNFT